MPIIQTVVQLSASQGTEKRRVIFELVSHTTPNHLRLCVILREFRNQHMKAVVDSAALVMNNVIIASCGCPNQAFPWERRVRGGISRVPILTRVRKLPFVVDTKGNNCGRQILGGMKLVEARSI